MRFNPAFIADMNRATRLSLDGNTSVTTANLSGARVICCLSDDSTRFRALVTGLVARGAEDKEPHSVVADGLDRMSGPGLPEGTAQVSESTRAMRAA